MKTKLDIAVIANLHREGILAYASWRSLQSAKRYAEQRGLNVEVIVVLDTPNAETRRFVNELIPQPQIIEIADDDLGRARNAGVRAAVAEWVSFIDGDDLWCENWLFAAHEAGRYDKPNVILHPFVNIFFGEIKYLFRHVDPTDVDFDLLSLALRNYWTSASCARKDLYLTWPYPSTNLEQKIGFEDWSWNLETIAQNCVHKIVPGTVHAIRTKPHSLATRHTESGALPVSDLFRQILERRAQQPSAKTGSS